MRYENLPVDVVDPEFIDFTDEFCEGNVVLGGTDELIAITNEIREKEGNSDLVGWDFENEVYYNFYLKFNTKIKEVSILAVCNYGEKDDEKEYILPMTPEEERNVLFTLVGCLARYIYNN